MILPSVHEGPRVGYLHVENAVQDCVLELNSFVLNRYDRLAWPHPISPVRRLQGAGDPVTAARIEAGHVRPHPTSFPWVKFYVFEILRFPKNAFADQVDTTSRVLTRLRGHAADDEEWATVGRSR